MNISILEAVQSLGLRGVFYGDDPKTLDEITDDYLNERIEVNGFSSSRLVLDGESVVTADQIKQKIVELQPVGNVIRVKRAAGDLINKVFPGWKQQNFTARAVELTNKVIGGGALSSSEHQEMYDMQQYWDWVKQVRKMSNQAEEQNISVDDIDWPSTP